MKSLMIISILFFYTALNAQAIKESSLFVDPSTKNEFTNSYLLNATNKVKTTLDIYNVGYSYKLPKVDYTVSPNPVNTGDYVFINPVEIGEIVYIFEPTGALIQSQTIDVDKKIDTIDLEKGEYFLKTDNAILNLLVE